MQYDTVHSGKAMKWNHLADCLGPVAIGHM